MEKIVIMIEQIKKIMDNRIIEITSEYIEVTIHW